MLPTPTPPPRSPNYAEEEELGWSKRDGARVVIGRLSSAVRVYPDWMTPFGKVAIREEELSDDRMVIDLTGARDARIILWVDDRDWVRCEVESGGQIVERAWIERVWEQFEFWPDGGTGVVGPKVEDDPPGKIGKHGAWLQIDTEQWPGLAAEHRWFQCEQATFDQ